MRFHDFSIIQRLDDYLKEKGDRDLFEIISEIIEGRKAGILPIPKFKRNIRARTVKSIEPGRKRTCNKCNKEFPWTRDFFYFTKKRLGYLSTICKNCDLIRNKKYRERIKEGVKEWLEIYLKQE